MKREHLPYNQSQCLVETWSCQSLDQRAEKDWEKKKKKKKKEFYITAWKGITIILRNELNKMIDFKGMSNYQGLFYA